MVQRLLRYFDFPRVLSSAEAAKPPGQARGRKSHTLGASGFAREATGDNECRRSTRKHHSRLSSTTLESEFHSRSRKHHRTTHDAARCVRARRHDGTRRYPAPTSLLKNVVRTPRPNESQLENHGRGVRATGFSTGCYPEDTSTNNSATPGPEPPSDIGPPGTWCRQEGLRSCDAGSCDRP